jgi:hypothetical protein
MVENPTGARTELSPTYVADDLSRRPGGMDGAGRRPHPDVVRFTMISFLDAPVSIAGYVNPP